jgi:hypothetical protein
MRNYWLKIILGAFAVFGVGMALRAAYLATKDRVRAIANSSAPITIPLAFVPFQLDGDRLGTFDHAVLIRKSPKQITGVKLGVKLSDSSDMARLAGCDLLAHFKPAKKTGAEFSDADFVCVKGDSAAAHGAERFGDVGFEPGGLNLALYVPHDVARRLRNNMIQGVDVHADVAGDSIAEAAARMGDSIGDAAARMGDSIAQASEARADSIRDAALRKADSARLRAHHLRDSVRAAHQPR